VITILDNKARDLEERLSVELMKNAGNSGANLALKDEEIEALKRSVRMLEENVAGSKMECESMSNEVQAKQNEKEELRQQKKLLVKEIKALRAQLSRRR
jgi:predicted  nucleic acid-binding Zn-ribbon protein